MRNSNKNVRKIAQLKYVLDVIVVLPPETHGSTSERIDVDLAV
jgi:hypothetical protein